MRKLFLIFCLFLASNRAMASDSKDLCDALLFNPSLNKYFFCQLTYEKAKEIIRTRKFILDKNGSWQLDEEMIKAQNFTKFNRFLAQAQAEQTPPSS